MMNRKKTSAGLSIMTVADLSQLPPVREKLLFSELSDWGSMKHETLLTCLINLELVTLMMILKSYSKEDLYMTLIKTAQKMPCTRTQRMKMLWRGMMLF